MRRGTIILLVAILIAHASLLIDCAMNKSAGYDEGPHLASGLAYLRFGETGIYNLSPHLLRIWAAHPANLAGAKLPDPKPFRKLPDRQRHCIFFNEFQKLNLAHLH